MQNNFSKKIASALNKLALYQITGGAVGILLILWNIYQSQLPTGFIILIYLVILSLFAYSIFCGIICLKKKKNALRHSLINQILQVIGIKMSGFAFKYIAGLYLTIELDLTATIKFYFGAGVSSFSLNLGDETNMLLISFNFIAFVLIILISNLIKTAKAEAAISEISEIGTV